MAKGKGGFIGQDGLNAPDAPTGVSGTAGDSQVTVSWTAPSDVGGSAITGYNVQTGSGLGPDSMAQEVDLGNGSYDSKEYTVARNDISMKADGTKWIGKTLAGVFYSYSMSTAFDITTSSQTSTIDLGSDTGSSAQGLHVKPDGTKFYVIDLTNTRVLQFAMSTAWDVSTASYESKLFSVSSQESSPRDVTFSEDGTKMYVVGTGSDAVFQYTLSTAWDVSTASYDSKSLDVSSEDTAPIGLDISRNGKNLVVGGAAGNDVNQYNLSTAFDVSTGSYDSTLATMNNGYFPALAGETDETTKMYVTSNSAIRQYSVGGSIPTITSSPFIFTGLTNGTSYTFNVWAINAFGWSVASDASGSVTPAVPQIGVFGGGTTGSTSNVIDTITISTTGNATDFGDLSAVKLNLGACSSVTRGVFGGGTSYTNVMEYVTFTSAGNASDFGDLTVGRSSLSGLSSSTRGVFGAGTDGSNQNVLDYITIASTGNATDFGDGTTTQNEFYAAFSSPTRGIFAGGFRGGYSNVIEYITIASTGNATDFGDLSANYTYTAGCSSSTRGLVGGSFNGSFLDSIDYITIATTGNGSDFGDLVRTQYQLAALSSNTRGVWSGGALGDTNVIQYVTIDTTGNAVDFGDLTVGRRQHAGCSSAHGGLQ
jgi:sugar lactone lactonase YvrE